MRSMSLGHLHEEILEAARHLPESSALVVTEVPWDDYEQLLEHLVERPRFRLSYDGGRLEILSPSQRHEVCLKLIEDLVRAFAQARKLPLEKFGQTTWTRRVLDKGVEPDACYYVENAERVIGKEELDLEFDPPPDIVVEIDITTRSMKKFSIYAALAVPEVWRYDGQSLRIYELSAGKYVEIPASRFLPGLSGSVLAKHIELSKTQGQTKALNAFIRHIRSVR